MVLLNVEGYAPVELRVGDIVFNPKLILKIERRISKDVRFLIERERVSKLLKPPRLI